VANLSAAPLATFWLQRAMPVASCKPSYTPEYIVSCMVLQAAAAALSHVWLSIGTSESYRWYNRKVGFMILL